MLRFKSYFTSIILIVSILIINSCQINRDSIDANETSMTLDEITDTSKITSYFSNSISTEKCTKDIEFIINRFFDDPQKKENQILFYADGTNSSLFLNDYSDAIKAIPNKPGYLINFIEFREMSYSADDFCDVMEESIKSLLHTKNGQKKLGKYEIYYGTDVEKSKRLFTSSVN